MNLDPLQAEPPAIGRLRLHTSQGPVSVELFSKETPKACRNIVQLSLEGFYDGLPFHRVVPDFIAQTGDPTGTGRGGTSIYAPLLPDGSAPDGRDLSSSDEGYFVDEFHPRLRFNKRGMLGMANANTPNTNQSQFFITLAPAPELQGKHTLFGRIEGPSMYTLLALLEGIETDEDGHPIPKQKAPRIDSVEVVDNPFEDIVPRKTQASRRAQQEGERARAKAERKAERKAEEQAQLKAQTKKRKVLLSFGDEEDDTSGVSIAPKKEKAKFTSSSKADPVKLDKSRLAIPGLIDSPKPSTRPQTQSSQPNKPLDSNTYSTPDAQRPTAEVAAETPTRPDGSVANQDVRDMEEAVLGRARDSLDGREAPKSREHPKSTTEEPSGRPNEPHTSARSWLADQKAQYKKTKSKDLDVLARLNVFRSQLKSTGQSDSPARAASDANEDEDDAAELDPDMREYASSSSDEDKSDTQVSSDSRKRTKAKGPTPWAQLIGHKFEDLKHTSTADGLEADDYAYLDPRGEAEAGGKDNDSGMQHSGREAARSRATEEKNRSARARHRQALREADSRPRSYHRQDYHEQTGRRHFESGSARGQSASSHAVRPDRDTRGYGRGSYYDGKAHGGGRRGTGHTSR